MRVAVPGLLRVQSGVKSMFARGTVGF